MSTVKMLKSCLKLQMHRVTPIEEMPKSETASWVQETLDKKNAEYAAEEAAQLEQVTRLKPRE